MEDRPGALPDPRRTYSTSVLFSGDGGRSWGLYPGTKPIAGPPGALVVLYDKVLVATTGSCTVVCIASWAATSGSTGSQPLPDDGGQAFVDATATGDGYLFVRTTTA